MSHNFFDALMKYQERVPNGTAFPPDSIDIGVTQQVWVDHMRVAAQGKAASEDVIQRSLEIAKKRNEAAFAQRAYTFFLERPGRVKILDRRSLVASIRDSVDEASQSRGLASTHIIAGPELYMRILGALKESMQFSSVSDPLPNPSLFGLKLMLAPSVSDISPNLGFLLSEGVRVYLTESAHMATKNSLGYEMQLRAAVYPHSGTFVMMG